MQDKTINPCREIIMSDYETCTISTGADAPRNDPKNDPKRKGKKKMTNLSDEQFEWVRAQTSQFSGKDSDIYTPQYGVSFFGRDIWVSEKICEWFILHYGTDDIQTSKDEEMRRLYAYVQKFMSSLDNTNFDSHIITAPPDIESSIESYTRKFTKSK